jgi:hypothetical protein
MPKHRTVFPSPILLAALAATTAVWLPARADTAPAPQPAPTQRSAPAVEAPSSSAATPTLEALAWLRGCWLGNVNRRQFLEQWSPPRGGMMVGFSHTVVAPKFQGTLKEKMDEAEKVSADPGKDKTQDFEYLRLEQRPDGVYYVAVPSGRNEVAFKLIEVSEESGAKVFTFANVVDAFPQRLVYRQGKEGWLYAQVTGKPGAAGSDVVYPMQHVDCMNDALLKR